MTLAAKSLLILLIALVAFWAFVQHRARGNEAAAEAAYPPEGQFYDIDGHRVHAVVTGEGPDLVWIHGSSGSTRDATFAIAAELATDYRLIIIDRPGLGYTDRINRTGATIGQQAALLQKTAAHLGAETPIVVGHSYGGAVAAAWAVNHPENLSALVLLSGATKPWDTGLSTYYKVLSSPVLGPIAIAMITAFVSDDRVEKGVASVFEPQSMPDGYIEHFGPGLSLRRHSMRANALQRANLLEEVTALHTSYDQISVPTEVAHGTADTTVGLHIHAEPITAQIPDARLTRLEGIGHMPQHAAQDAVIEIIHSAAARAGLRP